MSVASISQRQYVYIYNYLNSLEIQDESLRVLILELSRIYDLPITSFSREERRSKALTYAKIIENWDSHACLLNETRIAVWGIKEFDTGFDNHQ